MWLVSVFSLLDFFVVVVEIGALLSVRRNAFPSLLQMLRAAFSSLLALVACACLGLHLALGIAPPSPSRVRGEGFLFLQAGR